MTRLDDHKELLTDARYLDCCDLLQDVYVMEQFTKLTREQRYVRRALRREVVHFCDRSIGEAIATASAPPPSLMRSVAHTFPAAGVLAFVAWYLFA